MAVTHRDVADLCWDELPQMIRLISQCQTFELLYKPSRLRHTGSSLGNALVNLFGAVLRYQVFIVRYASSRTERFKSAFQGTAESLPQKILNDIRRYEAEVTKIQAFADREINDVQFEQKCLNEHNYHKSHEPEQEGDIEGDLDIGARAENVFNYRLAGCGISGLAS